VLAHVLAGMGDTGLQLLKSSSFIVAPLLQLFCELLQGPRHCALHPPIATRGGSVERLQLLL
jgi:hypothetical protein